MGVAAGGEVDWEWEPALLLVFGKRKEEEILSVVSVG